MIDPPRRPLQLPHYAVVLGRGPFTVEGERRLLARHRIDAIVCRASGGTATEAKILAARALGLPVVMLRRPATQPGDRVETVAAALDWVADRLDGAVGRPGDEVAAR
jgi:precorrin-6A/cobalt-precorrin-6A reductase